MINQKFVKRAFVCSCVPSKYVSKVKGSQAAVNFCDVIENLDIFDKVISIVPPTYYCINVENEKNKKEYLIGQNVFFVKYLMLVYYNFLCAYKLRKYESVWFYNLCNVNIISFLILRFFFNINTYVFLLDYTPTKFWLSVNKYIPFFLVKTKGIISCSSRVEIKQPNIMIKPGIIALSKIYDKLYSQPDIPVVLFSGVMSKHTGVELVIEAFKRMPDIKLIVSGMGDEKYLKKLVQLPNVIYCGYLAYEDYLKLYDKVSICLSLRNPNCEENKYNFPSKILEYFLYGKIVISTIEYPEISTFNYYKIDYDVEELIKVILSIRVNYKQRRFIDNREQLEKIVSDKSWEKCIKIIEKNND